MLYKIAITPHHFKTPRDPNKKISSYFVWNFSREHEYYPGDIIALSSPRGTTGLKYYIGLIISINYCKINDFYAINALYTKGCSVYA